MNTETPRRFRYLLPEGTPHPNGSSCAYRYGCYFPLTDLVILDMGERGTGEPTRVEWLDPAHDMVALVELTDNFPSGWMLATDREHLLTQLRATNAPALALVEAHPKEMWLWPGGRFLLGPNREGSLWLLLEGDE